MTTPLADDVMTDRAARESVADAGAVEIGKVDDSGGRFPKWAKTAIRLVIAAIVLAAVGRQILRTWDNWRAQGELFRVSMAPMAAAGVVYVVGLVVFGLYNAVIVRNVAPSTGRLACVRAYILSHPAKYVPGKAMVVVVRVGVLGRAGVNPAAASFSAIYETLSMMAVGGFLGGLLLMLPPSHTTGAAVSFGLGAAFLATVLPWTFGKAIRLLKKGLPRIDRADCPNLTVREGARLLVLGAIGWLTWGLSAVLVVSSLRGGALGPMADWPRICGAVMVGTVGGFALPILPGGLGLREGIYHEVTRGVLGPDLAIASAMALRFVWVVGELVASLTVSLIPDRNRTGKSKTSETSSV